MLIKREWLEDNTPYSPTDIDLVLDKVKSVCGYVGKGKNKVLNIPIAFDTETTSFYDDAGEKTAIVYVWMLGICGLVILGRTWDEWLYVYSKLTSFFRTRASSATCGNRIIYIYVHNLSFDFQFLRKHHEFVKIFALDKYNPLYARTQEGIEFRCSYLLSGYALATLGRNLNYHNVQKLTGDLDYRQLRHTQTPLTDAEKMYCINDVKVVNAYIDETIDREGDITQIPLTKTGYVRRYCRGECFKDGNYKNIIRDLVLSPKQFTLCKAAFQGGYTHANADNVDTTIDDVTSLDIISSYPSVMVAEQYPMSSPTEVTITDMSQFKRLLRDKCCVFTVKLTNLKPKHWFDFYLSASKCTIHGKRQLSNGRIVYADEVITTITNVDWEIITYMYTFDWPSLEIGDFIYFERDYLPTPFIKALLSLYQRKTELKGIPGKEVEYAVVKENQNSYYGMTVTSPVRPFYGYDEEWLDGVEPDLDEAMDKYNTGYNRFLYYPWGIYVTAYARRNVWRAIIECGDDHIYTDTDSEKCANFSEHSEFFEEYNREIIEKHRRACRVHGIDVNMCMPKNRKGEVKVLGAFELDGKYEQFKTLGAKRYLYSYRDGDKLKYGLTVAGLNKVKGMEYLKQTGNPFDKFADGLVVPGNYSGRMVHTYINDRRKGTLIDMYGNAAEYDELSAVHLEPTEYSLGIPGDFATFIRGRKVDELNVDS